MLQKIKTEPCDLFKQWGGECDPIMTAALGRIQGNMPYGCHLPHQDIVVPPSPYEVNGAQSPLPYIPPLPCPSAL